MSTELKQSCEINLIEIQTPAGGLVYNMNWNAAVVALAHKADVVFYHNGKKYKVHFKDLIGCVQPTGMEKP
jgi:saccharopine dehydrogenase-like NADP-dependent oxidoreductase